MRFPLRYGVFGFLWAVSALAEPSVGVFKQYAEGLSGEPAAFTWGLGGIWFTEPAANRIGVLREDGTIQEFAVPTANAGLVAIAATYTAEGDLVWFTEASANRIGRVSPDGAITEFPVPTPASQPWGIAADLIGEQVWFTERAGNAVARIASDGTITEYKISTPGVLPTAIALAGVNLGYDVWVALSSRNSIGRIPRLVMTPSRRSRSPIRAASLFRSPGRPTADSGSRSARETGSGVPGKTARWRNSIFPREAGRPVFRPTHRVASSCGSPRQVRTGSAR